MNWKQEFIAAAGSVLLVLPAYAQTGASGSKSDRQSSSVTATDSSTAKSRSDTGRPASDSSSDATGKQGRPNAGMVLASIHRANHNEIEMGNLAKEKSNNNAVKTYASQVIKDHQNINSRIQTFAKTHNIDLKEAEEDLRAQVKKRAEERSEMKEDAVRSREVQSPTGEYARPFGPEGLAPTTAHQEEMAELRSLKGQDFDRQFARDMVKDHQTLIERLTTVRSRINDSDLVQLIDKILPTLEKHQKMAEKVEGGLRTAG